MPFGPESAWERRKPPAWKATCLGKEPYNLKMKSTSKNSCGDNNKKLFKMGKSQIHLTSQMRMSKLLEFLSVKRTNVLMHSSLIYTTVEIACRRPRMTVWMLSNYYSTNQGNQMFLTISKRNYQTEITSVRRQSCLENNQRRTRKCDPCSFPSVEDWQIKF